ncbi:MAG: polysaccharide deacetylase family protein [Alphaproteobacteria bacterium]
MTGPSAIARLYRRQGAFANKFYRRIVPLLHRRPRRMANRRPIVSFTFDDFPPSALLEGAPILERHGGRGTYYVCLTDDRSFDLSREGFDFSVLPDMVAAGHELACHTWGHLDCGLTHPADLADDLDRNRTRLEELVPGYRMTNFAYPYGNVGLDAKALAGGRFVTARGIWSGLCVDTFDAALLPSHKIYGEENVAPALALIEEARRRNGWVVFFTHDVRARPTAYGSTPEQVERIAAAAAAAGCAILTVRDALDEIGGAAPG